MVSVVRGYVSALFDQALASHEWRGNRDAVRLVKRFARRKNRDRRFDFHKYFPVFLSLVFVDFTGIISALIPYQARTIFSTSVFFQGVYFADTH